VIRRALLAAAIACAGAAGLPAAQTTKAAPAARDWSRTVTVTPEGGYRMGNPNAPVKLIEYGSLTCGHCATFAREGVPQLVSRYVKPGRVSFEFRNYIRDPADMAAALLSRCTTPARYFALTERYFATQPQWLGKLQAMTDAEAAAIDRLPEQQRFARFSALGGLDAIAANSGGVAPARARQCLADKAAVQRLAAMNKVANDKYNLRGTPTFVVNGRTAEGAYDWASLEPLLRPPGS
jgi:protein-disulfide isomerase